MLQSRKKYAKTPATLEGCIVRLVDKIVYAGKDVEDAIASDIIKRKDVPSKISNHLGKRNGLMVSKLIENVIKMSDGKDYIAISEKYGSMLHGLIEFNKKNIYHSDKAERYKRNATELLKLLFTEIKLTLKESRCFKLNDEIPNNLQVYKILKLFVDDMKDVYPKYQFVPEIIAFDFVAGMTDTFALESFKEIYEPRATV